MRWGAPPDAESFAQRAALVNFRRVTNPFAIRRPAGGGFIFARAGQAQQTRAVGIAIIHIRAAAFAEDHRHPAAGGNRGGRVQTRVAREHMPLPAREIVKKDIRIAELVGGVINRELARNPRGRRDDGVIRRDRLRTETIEVRDINFAVRARVFLERKFRARSRLCAG